MGTYHILYLKSRDSLYSTGVNIVASSPELAIHEFKSDMKNFGAIILAVYCPELIQMIQR